MENKALRAKQFLPFDALKGFDEALRKKEAEIEIEEKIELSDELKEDISNFLFLLEKGNYVRVRYYNYNFKRYIYYDGIINEISKLKKKIIFADETKIYFEDILEISKI